MTCIIDFQGSARAGEAHQVLARLVNTDNESLTQADVSSISVTVTEADGTVTASAVSVAAADAVIDALVTDDRRWWVDEEGYNLAHWMTGAWWPIAGTYTIEYTITDTSDNVMVLSGEMRVC